MKKILVTGGAGFIGSHTCVELVNDGYEPVIVDNFSNSDKKIIAGLEKITTRKIPVYKGDFQDKDLIRKIFKEKFFSGVIHFAAYKQVGESVMRPLKYFDNNVAGLICLLQVLTELGIPDFVFSSSCTVYGEPDKLPLKENSPMKPAASPYGDTKQIGEIIIADTTKASSSLRSLSLRYFNPIGAHPSGLIGELPRGSPANLVPFVTQAAAGVGPQLTVFGNDYPTHDGTNIRDYIHVGDLAKAHVKALKYLSAKKAGFYDFFNIGTGHGSSVLEVLKTFEQAAGQKVPFKIGERRPGDVVSNYADCSKAEKILGWKAEITLLEALKDAWRWQKNLERNHE